jgi:hypothetical protein
VSSLLAQELARAEEALRVDQLIHRNAPKLSAAEADEAWLIAREEAYEAERAQGVGVRGLVSVPTTHKRALSIKKTRHRSHELREGLKGFVPPSRQGRIAKMRRAVGFSTRMHLAERPGYRSDKVVMVTATYADGVEWQPNHVRALLTHVRNWCKRKRIECRYVWVGEVQTKRRRREGTHAMHYHIALWIPFGHMLPKADAQGWWPHGDTKTELARNAVGYLMKYFSKGSDGMQLAQGARMYGVGGLDHAMRRARRWLGLPSFIKARADIFDDWRRASVGGGWVDPDGVCIPSEFQRTWMGDRFGLMRVADYGRPFDADGPFTWLHRSPTRELSA